ncbi:DNRLRE domain-containing protein, partial [Candidatus Woesearchaeota archaeon]|nr:DNRLRE domain-containing protein [Candidatus Woesearchaeota archaeon]
EEPISKPAKVTGKAIRSVYYKPSHYITLTIIILLVALTTLFLSKEEERKKRRREIFIIILIICLFVGIYFLGSGLSGLFVAEEGLVSYEQDVGWGITTDKELDLIITKHPEGFNLRTLKLSGSYIGNGTIKIHLKTMDGTEYLILDNEAMAEQGLAGITALFLEVEEGIIKEVPEEIDMTKNVSDVNITEEMIEKEARIELAYNSGTNFDPDNNGVEDINGVIDFTVANSEFNWEIDESKLCTRWQVYPVGSEEATIVCYGAQACCNFVELQPYMNDWDEPFVLTYGLYDSGYDNLVSAQIIYADLDTAEIYYTDWANLSAKFVSRFVAFEDICAETCILPPGLDDTEYKVVVEVESGILEIDKIAYTLKNLTTSTKIKEVEFNPTVRNAKNELVEYDIEFEDVDTKEVKKTEEIRKSKGLAVASAPGLNVKEGKYNIKVKPKNHPIKSIEINNVDIDSDISEFIDIDDAPEFGDFVEVYAIDPTRFNFTEATVTVTAKGSALYKCKDWDFIGQTCEGSWELFKTGLVPGQEYTFTLTPEDPGFAETMQPNATEGIDTLVNQNAPDTNYGSQTMLAAGESSGNYAAALIKFNDINDIPGYADITAAKLKLYFYDSPTDPANPINLSTRKIISDWTESGVTWNTKPAYSDQYSDKVTLTNNYGWVEWDVAEGVQNIVNGSSPNYGVAIVPDVGTAGTDKRFYSSDYSNASLHPILEVNYTTTEVPDISIIWPSNNTQHGTGDLIIGYNVTSESEIAGCSLINSDNGNVLDTDDSITKNTLQLFTLMINLEGTKYFNINCTDITGHTETSEIMTVYINASKADIYGKVQDSNGTAIDSLVEFIQDGTVKHDSTGFIHAFVVDDGMYDVVISPVGYVFNQVRFKDVNVTQNRIKIIDIEDATSSYGFTKTYSIDPTNFVFGNATVTITTAADDWLYKCKDWNFTTQTCYGNWSILKTDLAPGQAYNFTLTADDPGFAEQPGSEGKDTYLKSSVPNQNFGVEDVFQVKGDQNQRGLVEFNLSDIPSQAIIENATLELYVTGKGTGSPVINLYRINNSWTEGTGIGETTDDGATWNSRNGSLNWDAAGGDYDEKIWANTTLYDKDMWYSWNIAELVQNWVNGSYPNYGLMLKDVTLATVVWSFASSDNINSTIRPKINITYIASIPPNVTSIQITPATAYTNNDLNCSFIVIDEDAGDNLSVNYTWYNGTSAIIKGALNVTNGTQTSIILSSGNTSKNEVWNCSVIPHDGTMYGTERSSAKTIQNSLPTAPGVDVLPNSPEDDDDLVASITVAGTDADGDSVTYSYQWYKNEVLQPGLTTNTVSHVLTSIGENWSVVVTPNDGEGNGAAGEDEVTISGAAPEQALPIELISPANASTWTTSNNVIFQYNVSISIRNCSLIINNAIDQTDTNVTPNSTKSFTKTLSNGDYAWSVNCTNIDNSTNSSATWQLTVNYDSGGGGSPGGGGGGGGGVRRQCSDRIDNDGDGLIDYPNDPGCISAYDDDEINIIEGCAEYWLCSGWGECVNSKQARVCTDLNHCGTIENKPLETRNCTVEEVPEIENVTVPPAPEKVTGKTIEVLPEQRPNPYYVIPTILLFITLVAIIALRKTKLPEKIKNPIAVLHILLIVMILVLLAASFLGSTITGLVPLEGINATNIREIATSNPINISVIAAAIIMVIISFVLVVEKMIRKFKPGEHKANLISSLDKVTKKFKSGRCKTLLTQYLDKTIKKIKKPKHGRHKKSNLFSDKILKKIKQWRNKKWKR